MWPYIFMAVFILVLPVVSHGRSSIQCKDQLEGRIDAEGQKKEYVFDAKAGETVAIAISDRSTSALFQPCWDLYDASGKWIKRGCNQSGKVILRGKSPFTIRISDQHNDGVGDYILRLEPVSGHFNGKLGCAPTISCNSPLDPQKIEIKRQRWCCFSAKQRW